MQQPETRFIAAVHRRLSPYADQIEIVRQNNRFTNGRPDYLYLVPNGPALQVEYKVHPNKTSALQIATISRLRQKGFAVAIITKRITDVLIDTGEALLTECPAEWIIKTLKINNSDFSTPAP